MKKWRPLDAVWEGYQNRLQEADSEGMLDDPESAQEYVYPNDLRIGMIEREDIRSFVTDRMNEILNSMQESGVPEEVAMNELNLPINLTATYIFRALIAGMQWERDRLGR